MNSCQRLNHICIMGEEQKQSLKKSILSLLDHKVLQGSFIVSSQQKLNKLLKNCTDRIIIEELRRQIYTKRSIARQTQKKMKNKEESKAFQQSEIMSQSTQYNICSQFFKKFKAKKEYLLYLNSILRNMEQQKSESTPLVINLLQQQVKMLKAAVTSIEGQIGYGQSRIKELQQKIKSYGTRFRKISKRIKDLASCNQSLKNSYIQMDFNNKKMLEEISRLQNMLKNYFKMNSKLRQHTQQFQQDSNKLQEKITDSLSSSIGPVSAEYQSQSISSRSSEQQ